MNDIHAHCNVCNNYTRHSFRGKQAGQFGDEYNLYICTHCTNSKMVPVKRKRS